jgi:hypothetical protein
MRRNNKCLAFYNRDYECAQRYYSPTKPVLAQLRSIIKRHRNAVARHCCHDFVEELREFGGADAVLIGLYTLSLPDHRLWFLTDGEQKAWEESS